MNRSWRDYTSYSRGDTERVPDTVALELPFGVIKVHRMLGITDGWFLTARFIQIQDHLLKAKALAEAKAEALQLLYNAAMRIATEIEPLLGKET